jgi:hypothetical protein
MFSISFNIECLREKNVLYFSQCWMLEREKCSLFRSMLNAWERKMFSISVNVECLREKYFTLTEIENIFLSQTFNIDWNRQHFSLSSIQHWLKKTTVFSLKHSTLTEIENILNCCLFQSMLNVWERKMFSISVNVECLREKNVLYFSQCWMLEREKCSLFQSIFNIDWNR